MRLWPVSVGFLCALAVTPAGAQSVGSPDPVEAAQEEASPAATATPARKPTTPAVRPAAIAPASKPATVAVAIPPAKPEALKQTARVEPAKSDAKTTTQNAAPAPGDLSPSDRLVIQNALSWAGDYGAPVDGEDAMTTAIKNFQKRTNAKVTGVLAADEREALLTSGRSREAEYGWRVIDDAATGARLGVPTKMVPIKQDVRDGTRWTSRHGDVQVESFRLNNGLNIAAVFELEKKQPATRRVEYSVLRPDGFLISGLQGLRKFAVRAQAKDGEVRGFTVLYDQALEGIVEPVANAMASTFTPYPSGGVAPTASTKKVEYGSGVVVNASGYVVTDRRLTDNCQTLIAAGYGSVEPVASDLNFTLLRIYGARGLVAASLTDNAASGDVTLRGVPEPQAQEGNNTVKETAAKIFSGAIQPSPGGGYAGAGALDRDGKLAGLVSLRSTVVASTDPVAPQAALLSADTLRAFLKEQKVPADSAAGEKPTVMRLICVRK